jgi:glycine cleavage system aminomethyltransferase T
VCLAVDDERVPLHGRETVWRDGVCLGIVRATAFGHTLGRSLAYGFVDPTHAAAVLQGAAAGGGDAAAVAAGLPGKVSNAWLKAGRWEVGDKHERHAATLHLKAPYDPANEKIRA